MKDMYYIYFISFNLIGILQHNQTIVENWLRFVYFAIICILATTKNNKINLIIFLKYQFLYRNSGAFSKLRKMR